MADFGVCENQDCELSYHRQILKVLFDRIVAINNMEARQADILGMLPFIKHFESFFQFRIECSFESFFQFRIECSRCGRFLYRVIQPTMDLQLESEEYLRRSKLNDLLNAGYQLQAWGVLPLAS